MSNLDSILAFSKLMHKLSTTERFINKTGTNTRENLSEHCTQLAFTAWYLIEKNGLNFDKEKVFKYALVHDVVETYTGDFPTHLPDFDRSEKERLEKEAFETLKRDYSEVPQMWGVYEQYERREDSESKFIYALDKLLPGINIYLDSCKAWSERDPKNNTWSFDDLSRRIQHDPLVSEMWKELRERVKKDHPEFIA